MKSQVTFFLIKKYIEGSGNWVPHAMLRNAMKLSIDTRDLGLLKIINNITYFADSEKTCCMFKFIPHFRDLLKELFLDGEKSHLQLVFFFSKIKKG